MGFLWDVLLATLKSSFIYMKDATDLLENHMKNEAEQLAKEEKEMDRRKADLIKFSQTFKVKSTPIFYAMTNELGSTA